MKNTNTNEPFDWIFFRKMYLLYWGYIIKITLTKSSYHWRGGIGAQYVDFSRCKK